MSNTLNTPEFGPLKGVRVVFSAIEIAGPFSAQMLAEWGAEVIWVEHTAYADTIRVQPNYPELSRRNLYALSMNIFSDEGKETFLKLLESADILIEASKGPAFARRGLPDDLLWEHNPKLVIGHLSGFGQYGDDEFTNLAAYNTIAQAFSGYLIQNGDVDQPMPAFPYTGDYLAGYAVTSSVLAALYNAEKTGKGESIDIAMYEVLLNAGQYYMMDHFNGGKMCPRQTRGKDPIWVGCGTYVCNDGFIVMELVGVPQIQKMFAKLGISDWLGTEEYPEATQLISRESEHGPEVEDKLEAYMAARTCEQALAELAEIKMAGAKVLTVEELEDNPQYVARESIVEWTSRTGRKIKGPNIMPKFKNNPCRIWRSMPDHGQDTAAVLGTAGISDETIRQLAENGTIKLGDAD